MSKRALYKNFPGKYCLASTIWFPHPTDASKFATRIIYEGSIPESAAKLILNLQVYQRAFTPELEQKIADLNKALEDSFEAPKKTAVR